LALATQTPSAPVRKCLLILGMHRSGTSALTGVLSHLGCDIPKVVLPPSSSNVNGYFESKEICGLHDRLLADMSSSWMDWRTFDADFFTSDKVKACKAQLLSYLENEFTSSELFAIKDPRICRLMPMWNEIFS